MASKDGAAGCPKPAEIKMNPTTRVTIKNEKCGETKIGPKAGTSTQANSKVN